MKQRTLVLMLSSVVGASGCTGTAQPGADAASDAVAWDMYLAAAAVADRVADPVARCLAYPDLPGNQWPAGAAKARCPLLAEGRPSLGEVKAMLDAPGGVRRVDEHYAGMLAAHYDDARQRDGIFQALRVFDGSEDAERIASSWLERAPDSAFARVALGGVYLARASKARGSEWIRDVPADDLATMRRWLARAVPLLTAALEAEPRLSPACTHLMYAARLGGDGVLGKDATAHCLRVDPLSWSVRFEWQMGLDPRWHPSGPREDPFAALDRSVDELKPLVARNPALGGMLARAVGMRAYLAGDGQQSPSSRRLLLERASVIAPDPVFIGALGEMEHEAGNYSRALGYYLQASRLAPGNARFFGGRAAARRKLGDLEGTVADARQAIRLDGSVGKYHSTLGQALSQLGRNEEARGAYWDAMQSPVQRAWAFKRWCETYILHGLQVQEALACTEGLVSEFPDDAEAHFMRSWVLYETVSPGAQDAAARFHALADASDPRHRQMKSELGRISGR